VDEPRHPARLHPQPAVIRLGQNRLSSGSVGWLPASELDEFGANQRAGVVAGVLGGQCPRPLTVNRLV
jgi:hypothetical protein